MIIIIIIIIIILFLTADYSQFVVLILAMPATLFISAFLYVLITLSYIILGHT